MCQDSFPISPPTPPFPSCRSGGGVTRCPKQVRDYFDLIKIFPFMCVADMRNGSVGWLKVLTHLTRLRQLTVMKQELCVCVCVCVLVV